MTTLMGVLNGPGQVGAEPCQRGIAADVCPDA